MVVVVFVVVMLGVTLFTILWVLMALVINVLCVLPMNVAGLEFLVVMASLVVFALGVVMILLVIVEITQFVLIAMMIVQTHHPVMICISLKKSFSA